MRDALVRVLLEKQNHCDFLQDFDLMKSWDLVKELMFKCVS